MRKCTGKKAGKVCSISFDHLLTTSGPRGKFFPTTASGCISMIELLQFIIVRSFRQVSAKLCFRKRAIKMRLREERLIIHGFTVPTAHAPNFSSCDATIKVE